MSMPTPVERKPDWLRIRLRTGPNYNKVRRAMRELSLNTVCEEARCPNIFECWSDQTATFMILGEICTRRCGFCAVTSGLPQAGVDPEEPRHLAQAVERLDLKHAVITSVDRDDLPDALLVDATNDEGLIMGMRHRSHPTFGVQFHPESYLTPEGPRLLGNFLALARDFRR